MEEDSIFLTIEIPELEGIIVIDKFTNFRISGIITENPVVRLDNYIFEGKWFYSTDSIFCFPKKKKNLIETGIKNFSNDFLDKIEFKQFQKKFRVIDLKNFHVSLNFLSNKRLRLHRVPLLFQKK